jgi:hypothetical protein
MRTMLWVVVSGFAVSFAAGAHAQKHDWQVFSEPFVASAHAQAIDWQKVERPSRYGKGWKPSL